MHVRDVPQNNSKVHRNTYEYLEGYRNNIKYPFLLSCIGNFCNGRRSIVDMFNFCSDQVIVFPVEQLFPAGFVSQCPIFHCRRVCNNCKCTTEEHKVGSYKEMETKLNNLKIVDDNENVDQLNHYAWIPPGLKPDLVIYESKTLSTFCCCAFGLSTKSFIIDFALFLI